MDFIAGLIMLLNIEIWRVPNNWVHPRDEEGRFIPLYHPTYQKASETWLKWFNDWRGCQRTDGNDNQVYFWETACTPKRSYYKPFQSGALPSFQIYDACGWGIPQSPVFLSLNDLELWLIDNGQVSREFAHSFARIGFSRAFRLKKGWASCRIVAEPCNDEFYVTNFTLNNCSGKAIQAKQTTPGSLRENQISLLDLDQKTSLPTDASDQKNSGFYFVNDAPNSTPTLELIRERGSVPEFMSDVVTLLEDFRNTPFVVAKDRIEKWSLIES